jgi:hypothetical protein
MAKNATIKDRTLKEAMDHAHKTMCELPHIVQVVPSDWDIVILMMEVKRLHRIIDDAAYSKDNP